MSALEKTTQTVGDALEELRSCIFVPEFREVFKLTFVARHPANPEMDIVVTEDDRAGLSSVLDRRFPSPPDAAPEKEAKGGE